MSDTLLFPDLPAEALLFMEHEKYLLINMSH